MVGFEGDGPGVMEPEQTFAGGDFFEFLRAEGFDKWAVAIFDGEVSG
mgnify:CR=1 FL=1